MAIGVRRAPPFADLTAPTAIIPEAEPPAKTIYLPLVAR